MTITGNVEDRGVGKATTKAKLAAMRSQIARRPIASAIMAVELTVDPVTTNPGRIIGNEGASCKWVRLKPARACRFSRLTLASSFERVIKVQYW